MVVGNGVLGEVESSDIWCNMCTVSLLTELWLSLQQASTFFFFVGRATTANEVGIFAACLNRKVVADLDSSQVT
jgi:hypothetical protein